MSCRPTILKASAGCASHQNPRASSRVNTSIFAMASGTCWSTTRPPSGSPTFHWCGGLTRTAAHRRAGFGLRHPRHPARGSVTDCVHFTMATVNAPWSEMFMPAPGGRRRCIGASKRTTRSRAARGHLHAPVRTPRLRLGARSRVAQPLRLQSPHSCGDDLRTAPRSNSCRPGEACLAPTAARCRGRACPAR